MIIKVGKFPVRVAVAIAGVLALATTLGTQIWATRGILADLPRTIWVRPPQVERSDGVPIGVGAVELDQMGHERLVELGVDAVWSIPFDREQPAQILLNESLGIVDEVRFRIRGSMAIDTLAVYELTGGRRSTDGVTWLELEIVDNSPD